MGRGKFHGHDQGDDAERLAEGHVDAARDRDRLAEEALGRAGVVVEDVDDHADLAARVADRLADVARLELRELFGCALDRGGDAAQQAARGRLATTARQAGKAALARATAASASSTPASGTSASTFSVAGSITLSSVSVSGRHALPPGLSPLPKWPASRSLCNTCGRNVRPSHRCGTLTYFESLSPGLEPIAAEVRRRREGDGCVVSQSTHMCSRWSSIVATPSSFAARASGSRTPPGKRYLDAMSGGSMAATLGHGRRDIVAAARAQAEKLAYVHNERLTNPAQERAGARARGSRAGRLHARPLCDRRRRGQRDGAADRAQLPRGARRAAAVAGHLAGPGLPRPDDGDPRADRPARPASDRSSPTCREHLHIPPSTWRFDPTGEQALRGARPRPRSSRARDTVSAYFCEPISAAALPAYSPPQRFWEGLAERRERHGFLICFDEIVTGVGRTGHWFAAESLPIVARHHRHRQGPGRGLRGDRRRAVPDSTSTTRSPTGPGSSRSATPGTARRCRAPSVSRSSTCCERRG